MSRMTMLIAAALVLGGVLMGATLMGRGGLPDSEPMMTGLITEYKSGRILVEENPSQMSGNKCWLAITEKTEIFVERDGTAHKTTSDDLLIGQQVRVWVFGAVAESYPCQGSADAVLILSGR